MLEVTPARRKLFDPISNSRTRGKVRRGASELQVGKELVNYSGNPVLDGGFEGGFRGSAEELCEGF